MRCRAPRPTRAAPAAGGAAGWYHGDCALPRDGPDALPRDPRRGRGTWGGGGRGAATAAAGNARRGARGDTRRRVPHRPRRRGQARPARGTPAFRFLLVFLCWGALRVSNLGGRAVFVTRARAGASRRRSRSRETKSGSPSPPHGASRCWVAQVTSTAARRPGPARSPSTPPRQARQRARAPRHPWGAAARHPRRTVLKRA